MKSTIDKTNAGGVWPGPSKSPANGLAERRTRQRSTRTNADGDLVTYTVRRLDARRLAEMGRTFAAARKLAK